MDEPVIPATTPYINEAGRLSYIGEDGHRHISDRGQEIDDDTLEEMASDLRAGADALRDIQHRARQWLETVCCRRWSKQEAVTILLLCLENDLLEQSSP